MFTIEKRFTRLSTGANSLDVSDISIKINSQFLLPRYNKLWQNRFDSIGPRSKNEKTYNSSLTSHIETFFIIDFNQTRKVGCLQCDQIGRKFHHFGQSFLVFGRFLTVYFLFDKMLSLLWQICDIIGLI